FQAEDGIRDFHVTGVQTCALPISTRTININLQAGANTIRTVSTTANGGPNMDHVTITGAAGSSVSSQSSSSVASGEVLAFPGAEIGRASCRERVWGTEGGVSI